MRRFSGLFNIAAILCLVIYVIVGLGMSGREDISKVGAVAAAVGLFSMAFVVKKFPTFIKKYCIVVFTLSLSWFWAKDGALTDLTNYLVPPIGGMLFALLVSEKLIDFRIAVFLLNIPFFINLYAYSVGDNLTAELFDIDYDAAFLRFGGYVGHPSALVTRLLVPLVVFGLLKNYMPRGALKSFVAFLSVSSAVFSIYATGSKKSIFIALPFFFIILFFIREEVKSWRDNARIFGFLVFPMLLLIYATMFADISFGLLGDLEVFRRIGESLNNDDSTYDRSRLLFLGLGLIEQSLFFGYGLNQFSVVSGVGYYSHNNFIELMVSAGLLGLLSYIFVVYGTVISFFKKKKIMLGCSVMYLFLALDFTGVSYSDRGSQIIVCVVLFCATVSKVMKNEEKSFITY